MILKLFRPNLPLTTVMAIEFLTAPSDQRSEITQMESVAEIHVPDTESRRSGLYKCTKEYGQRVTVAVAVCSLLFREDKKFFCLLEKEVNIPPRLVTRCMCA